MHISPLLKEIKADQTIQASNYGGMRRSRFILPGYLKEGDEDWPQEMCKVLSLCCGCVRCVSSWPVQKTVVVVL